MNLPSMEQICDVSPWTKYENDKKLNLGSTAFTRPAKQRLFAPKPIRVAPSSDLGTHNIAKMVISSSCLSRFTQPDSEMQPANFKCTDMLAASSPKMADSEEARSTHSQKSHPVESAFSIRSMVSISATLIEFLSHLS